MAGFLFTGTARNEITREFYAEIDVNEGWTVRPQWPSMEELLNDQYGRHCQRYLVRRWGFTRPIPLSKLSAFPESYELEIIRKDYDKEEPQPDPNPGMAY